MRLGRASAYGMLAMIDIAKLNAGITTTSKSSNGHRKGNGRASAAATTGGGEPARTHIIAHETGIPIEYLRKVLQRLTRARLVISERGRTGGFHLARPATKIQLLDIFEAIEGPIDEKAFLGDGLMDGRLGKTHPQLKRWRREASEGLRDILSATTLSELLAGK